MKITKRRELGNPFGMNPVMGLTSRRMTTRKEWENAEIQVAGLDKEQLINRIKNFEGRFKLDFTDEHLNSLTPDRLRHILFAAIITHGKRDEQK